ncbi:DUF2971 domain-containing protein [Paenibacillus agricola]|uniref:DUF2971 domain-containing protein n=1 Tax=Paenibacillus agricola TaxID=2716264 RepID=A0ABX0JH16_9BACL|nr:DUF2971 domain-containing protein [Paenibacillus agricola]NHN34690.1 DUF2971 domain-containing protein [Paenibacillus agricola]
MGINFEDWSTRISSRSDLTGRLTHLTKPIDGVDIKEKTFDQINELAVDNLIKILTEQKLIGSSRKGFIVGNNKAVCFQETPLYGLIQNVEHEKARRLRNPTEKLRYCGVGLSFIKPIVYHKYNGRPVIYEKTEEAKRFLPQEQWWRIVDIEYGFNEPWSWNITDWTHEREWRVKGDMSIDIETDYIHIILYNPNTVKYFLEKCPPKFIPHLNGITTLTSILM